MRSKLTLETPIILDYGVEAPEMEEGIADRLLVGFQTLARQCKAGGSILDMTAIKIRADENPGHYPPEIPADSAVYSVNWKVSFSLGQSILFALDEAGEDYSGELTDCLQQEGLRDIADCEIGELYDELKVRLTGLLEEGRRPSEDV